MATKAILREQIRRILSGGNPSDRDRWRSADIDTAISDVANLILKPTILQTVQEQGMNNIDGLVTVTYENIEVLPDANWDKTRTSRISLPATPMYLENGQGVQAVCPSGQPHLGYKYIPESMFGTWINSRYVSPLHKRLFTISGQKIIVYDDLFGAGFTSADIRLVISDISKSGENDPLPLLPEHIDTIIGAVVTRFKNAPDTNRRETDQLSPSNRN